MNPLRVFNGGVCIVSGLVTAWNANRLAGMVGRGYDPAEGPMYVLWALAVLMMLVGLVFVQKGLRK